jgi:dihydroorotate dehydrogenase (NAD+) catalytic subunit
MSIQIGAVTLPNPVMTASGTFGYGLEFLPLTDLNQLGGIIVKGISLEPARGNPPPRIFETACGMLNAIGLENVGVEAFVTEKLPLLKGLSTPLFINIWGTTVDAYAAVAARIDALEGVAGIEVNISCPNIKAGGMAFGTDAKMAAAVVSAVRAQTAKTVMVKLSPNVTDITELARAVQAAGADAISLINTLTAMAVNINTRRSRLANITGGLSGPAIKPVALRMVWQVAQAVSVPVVGIGGIATAEDALEFLIVGASAVEVGTANFVHPDAAEKIVRGIEQYLVQHRIGAISELIGTLET